MTERRRDHVRHWRLARSLFRLARRNRSWATLSDAEEYLTRAGIDRETIAHEREWDQVRRECGVAEALISLVTGYKRQCHQEIDAAQDALNRGGGTVGQLAFDLAVLYSALQDGDIADCHDLIGEADDDDDEKSR